MTEEIITAGILFFLAAFAFFVSIRSFQEKGFLLNNAYLYASRQERETMNKKPHYRQSAIVFLLIGFIFLTIAFSVLCKADWLFYIVLVMTIAALVYAVVSSVMIERNAKQR